MFLWVPIMYIAVVLMAIGIQTLWRNRLDTRPIHISAQDAIIMRANLDYNRQLLLKLERNARSQSYRNYIRVHLFKNQFTRNILDKNIK